MAIMNAIDKRLWGGPLRIMASQMQTSLNCGTTQAGRGNAAIDNPYCASTTYTMRDAPEQAMSVLDSNGRPVIVVSSLLLDQTPSYGRFLLAHECCHHTLGHVQRDREEFGHVGPQLFFYIAPKLKQMKLDADCCAVRMLNLVHEADSIDAGRQMMAWVRHGADGRLLSDRDRVGRQYRRCAAQD